MGHVSEVFPDPLQPQGMRKGRRQRHKSQEEEKGLPGRQRQRRLSGVHSWLESEAIHGKRNTEGWPDPRQQNSKSVLDVRA